MNTIIRQKGDHMKLSLLESFKRYLKPNSRTYSSLKYNYNARRYALSLASNTSGATTRTVINAIHQQDENKRMRFLSSHDAVTYRQFHSSLRLNEVSSKVDATVKKLKTKQKEKVEEIMKEVANASTTATEGKGAAGQTGTTSSTAAAYDSEAASATVATSQQKTVVKRPLKDRIWEEIVHYYHGFRLLFIDVSVSSKLLWRVLNGKTLTRRENNQLLRTTTDLFRLIPFSIFIIVPFMELLLPLFIKFFPGMLPSTFQTAKERDNQLRQSLSVRLEMAKFLQRTLDEMPLQHQDHKSEEAKQFEDFFEKVKAPTAVVSNEDIIKFAKRFDDEITLDALTREQLAALCRVLELNTIGTTTLLRFQLRLKLRSLYADDRVIAREGVDSLDLFELQQACKSRGMRAYGLTAERLRFQLKEWIDLSLNERVPPTLLLLSRTMFISDDSVITDKLKETMRGLPDAVAAQTKHAISEREGKIDHKTKIEIIKEEERKIKEEREEEREENKAKRTELGSAEDVPYVSSEQLKAGANLLGVRDALKDESGECKTPPMGLHESEKGISSSDVRLLSDALMTLSSDKKLVVEKETIKELKEELADYKDDVEELREVRQVVKEPVHESRAAKLLYNRVNKMIGQLDKVLNDLEQKQEKIRKTDAGDIYTTRRSDFVHIDELVSTIKRMKEASDETRFKVVEDLLLKLDDDKDGAVTVNEIMKVVKNVDNTQIDKKQLDEFITLLSKQAQKRQQEEIVHIGDLMRNIKKLKETSDEVRLNHIESVLDKFDSDKDGVITINEILKVVESLGRENVKLGDKQIEELIALLDKEQILHAEEKIEKAIAKSMKEANKLKAEVEKSDSAMNKLVDNINDSAQEIKDIAKELGAIEKTDELKDIAQVMKDKAAEFKNEAPIKDIAKALGDSAKELQDATKSSTNLSQSKATTPTNPIIKRNPPPKKAAANSMSPSLSSHTETVIRKAAERQVDKLLPHQIAEDSSILPPTATTTFPPSKSSANAAAAAPAQAVNANTKKVL